MIKYIKRPDYVVGIMGDGTKFFFDEEDIKTFKGNDLRIDRGGYLTRRTEDRGFERIHRLLLGLTKHDKVLVDHINRNPLDNRRCNLRLCTNAENLHNRGLSGRNKTGTTGVYKLKNNKYWAYIGYEGKLINLGRFVEIGEAIKARKQAEEKYYREYKPRQLFEVI